MKNSTFVILAITVLVLNVNNLAFGEISSFSTDKKIYLDNEPITFSVTVTNHEDLINVLVLNPRGDLKTILSEKTNEERVFEFQFNTSNFVTIQGVYKIVVHTTNQPVYDGKAILFEFVDSTINVLNTESKIDQLAEPLPPNCREIKTENLTTVICDDIEDGQQIPVEKNAIPLWVKQTSLWWNQGNSSDKEFIDSLSFLIAEKIIDIPGLSPSKNTESVPNWIKTPAGWWAKDQISKEEFVNAIKYLVEKQVIKI